MKYSLNSTSAVLFAALLSMALGAGSAAAASATEIDIEVDAAIKEFSKEVTGGAEFLNKAKGVLVIPGIVKAGFGIGGEYGKGALRIDGKSVHYYSIASASLGFQIGAQKYTIVMVFLEEGALKKFQESDGWEAGVDGSVAVAKWGTGKDINTQSFQDPIVAFVFSNKGLMAGISIEGSKISKLDL